MLNFYLLILLFFTLGGLTTAVWGWKSISHGRRSLRWPKTQAILVKVSATSKHDDLLPEIIYEYSVNDKSYQGFLEFPSGTHPCEELVNSYLDRYHEGDHVIAHVDPEQPQRSTLEPGPGKDDWFIFMIGIVVFLFGMVLILLS